MYPGDEGITSPMIKKGANKRDLDKGNFNAKRKHRKVQAGAH